MPSSIQPINAFQNGLPQTKTKERSETNLNERPERAEKHNVSTTEKAETRKAEEAKPRENLATEKPEPQEGQNSQANKQLGKTLDIMA